ncbi:hypothetical protein QN277_025468 [Acacia crassicarpa]|uniref:Uncharacterized protein n=1 Tax=Acacia crassicarpa TaxID=499986 RepID=A0AAE1MGB9_9FABA|nr:hypothetical protein QN277_025468 [Acacia crassicarpa]
MDSRGKSNKSRTADRSLCEKSMKVVSNIIRISSFSLAQMTLGATVKAMKEEEDMVADDEVEPSVVLPQFGGTSRRLQEPQNRPNRTYVIKPEGAGGRNEVAEDEISHHHHRVVHHQHEIEKKEVCVDGLASDYIKKIRNQIGCGL